MLSIATQTQYDDGKLAIVYSADTGRLRIFEHGSLVEELFPPQSWFAIATVARDSDWGTQPTEQDLQLVLEDFERQKRFRVR